MKSKHYITNSVAVDRFCAVKIADLNYKQSSRQPDDHGCLYVAPIVETNWKAPLGLLAIYATTNGDPILLGQIEGGEVSWFEENDMVGSGLDDSMREVLKRADWCNTSNGEGYSYLIEELI